MIYDQYIEIADQYRKKGNFKEAERFYRQALSKAQPHQLLDLLDVIKQMKLKAAKSPKPEKEKASKSSGFTYYKIRFSDVLGYKPHKRLMREFIETPIKYAEIYTQRKMPRSVGILMYGAPGTGKTYLAKAVAGELNLPMREILVSDILGRLIGESEKNMKEAFELAKANQPCILFFDELDALGSQREGMSESTSSEIKNTINEFLQQMSRLHDDKDQCVAVIGATNLPHTLDPALRRSGRFGHHIYMKPPNLLERIEILKYYLKMDGVALRINWFLIGMASYRYSQADLEQACNSLKRRTLEKKIITTRDMQRILKDKMIGGSSLDAWILEAEKAYIRSSKQIIHQTGFLGLRKQKEKVTEQGKLTKEEMKTYAPMINSIKSFRRWWWFMSLFRFLAQGF